MGSRKRAKPNPKAEVADLPQAAESVPLPESPEIKALDGPNTKQNRTDLSKIKGSTTKSIGDGVSDTQSSAKSWYSGTWPKAPKATPITQIAKESVSSASRSISSATGTAVRIGSSASQEPGASQGPITPISAPSLYLSRSLGRSSRSLPLSATTTKVNASSDRISLASGQEIETDPRAKEKVRERQVISEDETVDMDSSPAKLSQPKLIQSEAPEDGERLTSESVNLTQQSWLGWLARNGTVSKAPLAAGMGSSDLANNNMPKEKTIGNTLTSDNLKAQKQVEPEEANTSQQVGNFGVEDQQPPRSWLGLWNNTGSPIAKGSETTSLNNDANDAPKGLLPKMQVSNPEPNEEDLDTTNKSGWAFWSRANASSMSLNSSQKPEVGELAVAGSNSQSKPENATVNTADGVPATSGTSAKRGRPSSLEVTDNTKQLNAKITNVNGNSAVALQTTSKPKTTRSAVLAQSSPPNLILPSLKKTFVYEENPGLLQQLRRLLYVNNYSTPKHVKLLKEPPRIKKALSIGIHGYFPAPLIRSVLGQPTGTSIRFAESAASAIKSWTKARGYSCEVEKIALEGEGKIEERVDLLWKLLLNWIDDIRKADFILVACHSQGVPVAIMLVAKLISFGCVNGARVGVCAMAGVNLGPFADYKSRWISGSAGELFDFAKPDSIVSKDYEAALESALKFGVKILYIGSIDDQLVSLEVSTHLCRLCGIRLMIICLRIFLLVVNFWYHRTPAHLPICLCGRQGTRL